MTAAANHATPPNDLPAWPQRTPEGHKGTYGRVLIVAGSRGMAGAALLAGQAALRGGAGLVTVGSVPEVASLAPSVEPGLLTRFLPADQSGRVAGHAWRSLLDDRHDVLALGPGLGQSRGLRLLLEHVLERGTQPLVLDADALNLLAWDVGVLAAQRSPRAVVLTPHPGEFARLTGRSIAEVTAHGEELARDFAREHRVLLVLKGNRSIVTDGETLVRNATGNPGLASGGTGDVLTGLVAATLAQFAKPGDLWERSPLVPVRLAVHLHGLAADTALGTDAMPALTATQVLAYVGPALAAMTSAAP